MPLHLQVAIVALHLAGLILIALAALHDIGFRTIPNRIPLCLLVCGLCLRALEGDLAWGSGAGAIVFCLTALAWRMGWMGGGDVKLLTAASVFVAPLLVPTLILGTSLAGGLLALVYLLGPRLAPPPGAFRPPGLLRRAARCELWRLRRRGPLPYAAAIATGGVFAMLAS